MANRHPELADSARVIFDAALRNFKSKLTSELWVLSDLIQKEFDGYINRDTAAVIDAISAMIQQPQQAVGSNKFTLGKFMVLTGQYQEGMKYLLPVKSGEDATTNPIRYLRTTYYLGLAYEALGEADKAVAEYEEIMKYWGNADHELKDIADTRERLNRLRS